MGHAVGAGTAGPLGRPSWREVRLSRAAAANALAEAFRESLLRQRPRRAFSEALRPKEVAAPASAPCAPAARHAL